MRSKRGQLEISFGMIFSIIMIIAILAVSFYVIQYFIKISRCSSTGLFYDSLQKEIDTAWNSGTVKQQYSHKFSSGVEYVCFGNMSLQPRSLDKSRFDDIYRTKRLSTSNVFMYPLNDGCTTMNSHLLQHASFDEFFCIKVDDGVSMLLSKGAFDSSVKVSP